MPQQMIVRQTAKPTNDTATSTNTAITAHISQLIYYNFAKKNYF